MLALVADCLGVAVALGLVAVVAGFVATFGFEDELELEAVECLV
jgi:hypothetical protein